MLRRLLFRFWREGIWIRLVIVAVLVLIMEISPVPLTLVDAVRWAETSQATGDFASAAEAYSIAYAYQPWVTDHLAQAAESELRAGHYNTAELYLNQLAEIRLLRPHEILWLGSIYAGQGRIDEAIATWEAGRAQGAIDPDSLNRLAEIYMSRREWAKAAQVLQLLTQVAPTDARLFYRLGLIQALDQPDWAAAALSRAISLDERLNERLLPLRATLINREGEPPDLLYARLGVIYLTLGEYPLSEEALSRALALNPAYGEALAYLAYVRIRQGKPGLGAAQQAIALNPDSPIVLYLAGLAWMEHERSVQARALFEKAHELDPRNPAFAAEIGSTYRAESAYEWAELWMNEAAYLAGDDVRFQILLVQFYVDEEYLVAEKGLPLARTLAEQHPDNAQAREALGWAYFLTGQIDLARDELTMALALQPDLARAHFHYAVLLETEGRLADAITHYNRASLLEPDGSFGALARRALKRLGVGG